MVIETGAAAVDRGAEPRLAVQPRFFLRRRFLWSFLPIVCAAVVGAGSLVAAEQVRGPFRDVVTLYGLMGSKRDFFEDPQVERILLSHGIRLHITATGSREGANMDLRPFDFVFPSGRPSAQAILDGRKQQNLPTRTSRPFVSPLVLATYREYAETLRDNGIATARGGDEPLYYDVDMTAFFDAVRNGKTWNALGIGRHGVRNGNRVLAQTPNVCEANSAGTYLALAASAVTGQLPTTEQEADEAAAMIKPLLVEQGLPVPDLLPIYLAPEGAGATPLVVIYEHQYLAHQVRTVDRTGEPDRHRVLLYPVTELQTLPEFIALKPAADRLAELVESDDELRRRAMELGFRVLDAHGRVNSPQLSEYLAAKGIAEPTGGIDDTRGSVPALPLLDRMIETVGDCR